MKFRSVCTFFLLFLGLAACSGAVVPEAEPPEIEAPLPEPDPPAVTGELSFLGISPADGASDVPYGSLVRISFDRELSPAAAQTSSIVVRKGGERLGGQIAVDGKDLVFIAAPPLEYNSEFEVTLAGSVQDTAGRPLKNFPPAIVFSTETFSTELPLVLVDTGGQNIPDDPKIPARMKIIANEGAPNFLDDPANAYDGWIGIEVRGHFSQSFPKKQYGFETWEDESGEDESVELLDLPEESDWILQGPYSDRSLLRNDMVYELSRRMGHYASRVRFAEVFLNGGYQGVFAIMEKIKRDDNRVDIARLRPTDNAEPNITGGYILALDRPDPGDGIIVTARGTQLMNVEPEGADLTEAQRNWITAYLNAFEAALDGPDFADPATGYAAYLDVAAFIDFYWINEIVKNPDAFRYSTFLHKDRLGKLTMGPVWDFDLAWHNDFINLSGGPEGFFSADALWMNRLRDDPAFVSALQDRYRTLREDLWNGETIGGLLDDAVAGLGEAVDRNYRRWPAAFFGRVFIGDGPKNYDEEIQDMKDWLARRLDWIDAHLEEL